MSRRDSTKQSTLLVLIVVVIVIVGAAAAGIFLTTPGSAKSSTTISTSSSVGASSSSSSTLGPLKPTYETLTVGYQGGLFQLGLENVGGKQITGIVATLSTPVQTVMCTGGSTGAMGFGSCLPAPHKTYTASPANGGSFPANTTFTGFDSGVGPGSAVAGQSYPLVVVATYVDGTSSNQTFAVQASSG